jgi:cellulose biosynthesis protein BcsQ
MDELPHVSYRESEDVDGKIIIALMNNKGGCAKSSLCDALAHYFAIKGLNVLVIDNDSQCNLSQRFGLLRDDEYKDHRMDIFYENITNELFGEKQLSMPIKMSSTFLNKQSGGIYLIPGHPEAELKAVYARNRLGVNRSNKAFKDYVRFYRNYFDVIIIDTPPATYNSVSNQFTATVADEIIIPFDGSEAVHGVNSFMEWLTTNFDDHIPNGMFAMTKYQCDTKDVIRRWLEAVSLKVNRVTCEYCSGSYRLMKEVFGEYVCDSVIPERRVYKNHTFDGLQKYFTHKKKYIALCEEITAKIYSDRPNLFKLYQDELLNEKLETLMVPLEHGRHDSADHAFTTVVFDGITKAKNKMRIK